MPDFSVQLRGAELAAFLADNNGPVMRYLLTKAEDIRQNWLSQMQGFPRDYFGDSGQGRIVKRVVKDGGRPMVAVGSARVKTNPHPIDAVNGPFLVFEASDGTLVFTPHVNHPGSDFTDYLIETGQAAIDATKG